MPGPIAIDRQATLHLNLRDDPMEVVMMTLLEALKPATFGCGFAAAWDCATTSPN